MKGFMDTGTPGEMKRPAREDAIPVLIDFVATHAREMHFPEERIREIGEALEETLRNIVRFACADGTREISMNCTEHEMGALVMEIRDTGRPFNMLVASSFPQTADFMEPGKTLSTGKMKKAFKNIEYRRDADKGLNILVCVISK
jgi:anti-sigma regulatory factor (Ser/Thr protein kinase)